MNVYLGNGVYFDYRDLWSLKLTASNGGPFPTNTVYIDTEMLLKMTKLVLEKKRKEGK